MQYIISLKMYNLVSFNDPVLRQVASEVQKVDDNVRLMLNKILTSMYHNNAIGFGAPQLGISKRIFVVDLGDNDPIKRAKGFYPKYCINPKIITLSDNLVYGDESTPSLPGINVMITRPDHVTISFLNYYGANETLDAKGLLARVCLHEIDYLNGKLIIDHVSPLKRKFFIKKIHKNCLIRNHNKD